MPSEIYSELREYLDEMPGGFPATDSGVELKMLEKMFTPEDARLTMQLRLFPEPPRVIAKRWGMSEAEAAAKLTEMANKGIIIQIHSGKEFFYQSTQYQIGFLEFHIDTIDRELAEYASEFELNLSDSVLGQHRVIPVGAALDTTSDVASYDRARELVRKQKIASVTTCICKKQQGLLDNECARPHETCLSFGIGADHMIRTGKGREITLDEAMRIIDRAEENALILMPTNARDIVHICCCCSCCCALLRMLNTYERPAEHVHSAFHAKIDPELCTNCETCLERCQMDALHENDGTMEVDLARCIGCGLCVSTCPEKAATLVAKAAGPMPSNYLSMLSGLAKKRGRGFGNLDPLMKVTSLPLFVKMLPLMYKSGLARPLVDQLAKRGWV